MTLKSRVLLAICVVVLSTIIAPQTAKAVGGSWVQTSRGDFESDNLNNVDVSSSPGDAVIAGGGPEHMGLPAVNSTAYYCCIGLITYIMVGPGTAAPVSGSVVRFSVFSNCKSAQFDDQSGSYDCNEYCNDYGCDRVMVQLLIYRNNSTHYNLVGSSPQESVRNGENTYSLSTPIPVSRGDLIGVLENAYLARDNGQPGDLVYQFGFSPASAHERWIADSYLLSLDAELVPRVTGTIVSTVKDTLGSSSWGSLTWGATAPRGTGVALSTRSSVDSTTWSDWSGNYTSSGSSITSPPGRFIQYRAVLFSNSTLTPVLHDVTISYDTSPSTSSSILLGVSTSSLLIRGKITVSGIVTPPAIRTVTLTYTSPNGPVITRTVTSNSAGFFQDSFSPDLGGRWNVTASSPGSDLSSSAQSVQQTFQVQDQPSFLQSFAPWLVLAGVVAGFGVAVFLTKPKGQKNS